MDNIYKLRSILVSTNWNKNDDVFTSANLWKARNSAYNTQANLEHDSNSIIGHVMKCVAVDKSYTPIAASQDYFHLMVEVAIYKTHAKADELIGQIENGQKFVSMECLFPSFSYGIVDGDKHYELQRDRDTAFLTKHLKSNGGSGTYNGCRVGRILENIAFDGLAFVDKPANPHSTILATGSDKHTLIGSPIYL